MSRRGYAVCEPGAVEVLPERGTWSLCPTHLSPIDLVGLVARDDGLALGDSLSFRLAAAGRAIGPIQGVLARMVRSPFRELPEAEVVFERVPLEIGRAILGLAQTRGRPHALAAPPRAEEIFEPGRVDAVLRALRLGRAAGRVRVAGAPGPRVEIAAVHGGRAGGLVLAFDGPPPPPPFRVELGHFNSVFSFRIDAGVARDRHLECARPDHLTRQRTRLHRRAPAADGATVSFRHPVWPDLVVDRPLVDVSFGGLAFRSDGPEDTIFPGLEVPEVRVTWPGRGELLGCGEVRHVSDDRAQCGVRLILASTEAHAAWTAAASERLYTHTAAGVEAPTELWELYARAGYFELSGKNEQEFAARRAAFAAANQRLRQAPEIGCQIGWPSPRGLEAAVTMLKPYARAWVGFQLARRRDGAPTAEPRQILREVILHGYEYPQRDPDFEWLVTWVQTSGRFSRRLMHDLTSRFGDLRDQAAIVRFRALEGRTDRPLAVPDGGLDVGPPRDGERLRALAAIRATRPWPYVAAHDLVPDRFELTAVCDRWRAAGLARERAMLVARRGDRAVAAAVLELAEDGIHLFALFDVVHLYAIEVGGATAFPTLLEAARGWYAARGKATFVYFCEEEAAAPELTAGLVDLGAADMTVLAAGLLPDQLEHAWEITAPREAPVEAAVP